MTITCRTVSTQARRIALAGIIALGLTLPDARSQTVDAIVRANAATVYVETFEPTDTSRDIRVNALNVEYERRLQHESLRRIGVGGIFSGYFAKGTSYDLGKLFTEPDGGVYPVDTTGWGLQGLLRLYLVDEPQFTLFVEGAAGIAFFDDRFPPQGTKLNFTRRYGAGGTYRLSDTFDVIGGYRVAHVSNGNGDGAPDNPAWDGRGPYLGIRYRF
jgi:Lipid A 3-O-deacylase (PagL)